MHTPYRTYQGNLERGNSILSPYKGDNNVHWSSGVITALGQTFQLHLDLFCTFTCWRTNDNPFNKEVPRYKTLEVQEESPFWYSHTTTGVSCTHSGLFSLINKEKEKLCLFVFSLSWRSGDNRSSALRALRCRVTLPIPQDLYESLTGRSFLKILSGTWWGFPIHYYTYLTIKWYYEKKWIYSILQVRTQSLRAIGYDNIPISPTYDIA